MRRPVRSTMDDLRCSQKEQRSQNNHEIQQVKRPMIRLFAVGFRDFADVPCAVLVISWFPWWFH
jgi:hypothetical protein